MDNYGENLTLNLGTDIVGVVITVFVIGPLISRAQRRLDDTSRQLLEVRLCSASWTASPRSPARRSPSCT